MCRLAYCQLPKHVIRSNWTTYSVKWNYPQMMMARDEGGTGPWNIPVEDWQIHSNQRVSWRRICDAATYVLRMRMKTSLIFQHPIQIQCTRCLCNIQGLYVILEPDEASMEHISEMLLFFYDRWYWSDCRFKSDQASPNLRSDRQFRCYDWSIAWPIYSFVHWASK